MRTLKGQDLVRDTDEVKFPDGQIQNKTDVVSGTPVVREVYGDMLTNIYKLLRRNGVTPNELEDSEENEYQLVEALKNHFNELNDIRQVLSVSGNNLTTTLDLSFVSDNYVFIGLVSDPIDSGNFNIIDSNTDSYPITVKYKCLASSYVLVVFNRTGGFITPLENSFEINTLNTSLGTPLSFNESENLLFLSGDTVFNTFPNSYDIQGVIRTDQSNNNLLLLDCIFHKNTLIAMCVDTNNDNYHFYAINDTFNGVESEITVPIDSVSNNNPYMYCDGSFIYFTNTTNDINDSANDYDLGKFEFDEALFELNFVSSSQLNASFEKTTNVFINSLGELFTFVNTILNKYSINSGTVDFICRLNSVNGYVFKFNGKTYYTNGSSAVLINY